MRNILDIAKQGSENLDLAAPVPIVPVEGIDAFTATINKFPYTKIDCEVNDGTKHSVEVHTLLLSNPKVFDLVWKMAVFEPMVYARKGNHTKWVMLSPNYDLNGVHRLPTIKGLPQVTPDPLILHGSDLFPDSKMATMLAGAAHAEGKGVGGHNKPPQQEYEHKEAFLGAISLGSTTISDERGRHVQHTVRKLTSVATGLTNGTLGNIFTPDGDRTAGFSGYGTPVIFEAGKVEATDAIFIPKGFLQKQEAAFGVYYSDAARDTYGSGLQIMRQRLGEVAFSTQLKMMEDLA